MFKSSEGEGYNDYSRSAEDTIIGGSIKVEGDLSSAGSIIIEGEVTGEIKTEKNLRVGDKARVKANVTASDSFVAGRVDGNITVSGKLELSNTAEVNGDIAAGVLIIAAGAKFNGRCSMSENPAIKISEVKEAEPDED